LLASDDHEAIAQVLANVAEQRAQQAQQWQQQQQESLSVSGASAAAVEAVQQQLEQVQLDAAVAGGAGDADTDAQQEAGQQDPESCPVADTQLAGSDAPAAAEGDPAAEGSSGRALDQEASNASHLMAEDVVPGEVQAESSRGSQAAAGGSGEAVGDDGVGEGAELPDGEGAPADQQRLEGAEVSQGVEVGAVEDLTPGSADS
jgi:hypothetical protein